LKRIKSIAEEMPTYDPQVQDPVLNIKVEVSSDEDEDDYDNDVIFICDSKDPVAYIDLTQSDSESDSE